MKPDIDYRSLGVTSFSKVLILNLIGIFFATFLKRIGTRRFGTGVEHRFSVYGCRFGSKNTWLRGVATFSSFSKKVEFVILDLKWRSHGSATADCYPGFQTTNIRVYFSVFPYHLGIVNAYLWFQNGVCHRFPTSACHVGFRNSLIKTFSGKLLFSL